VCAELLSERSRFEYRGEAQFRRWLYQATEHKLIERARYWRSAKRALARDAPVMLDNGSASSVLAGYACLFTPSRDACAREDVERLERAFDALPPAYREIIVLSRYLGCSHAEIAARLGKTEGAVRTLLCRALARLSELLAQGQR
jgi:RNA polymerase sigma factor (sigma-70 family)